MADFSPLIGKSGKSRALTSADALQIVTGSSLKVADDAGLTINGVAANATGFAAKIGVDPASIANSAATDLQTMLNDLDIAISAGSADQLNEIWDNGTTQAHSTVDLANNGGFEMLMLDTVASQASGSQDYYTARSTSGEDVFKAHKFGSLDYLISIMNTGIFDVAPKAAVALSGTWTWNGTTTVTSTDTSQVVVGNWIRLDSDGQYFRITAITANTDATIDNSASLTIPSGATGSSFVELETLIQSINLDTFVYRDMALDSKNLTLRSNLGGDLNLTASSTGDINMTATGNDIELDSATLTADFTGAMSLDAAAASNVTVAGANLTLSTTTSGDVIASAAGALDFDGVGGDIDAGTGTLALHADTAVTAEAGTTGTISLTAGTTSGAITLTTAGSSNISLAAGGDIDANSNKIVQVAAGTASTDAVNKSQLDAAIAGMSWKDYVDLATTGSNITLSGEQTIDGTLTSASRVLVKDQTAGAENGIYVTASGAWTRATDMDGGDEADSAAVFVESGTANADTAWLQLTDNVTIGTTAQSWSKFSSGAEITASTGLTKSVNDIQLADAAASNGIAVSSGAISAQLEAAGAGTGGLSFDNNEIRVTAGDGIELTASGVAVDLLATSGLSFSSGELQLDDSVAGTGLSIASKVLSVDYGSSAGNAVEGNTTYEVTAGSGLTGGQSSVALGAGNISYTLSVDTSDIRSTLSTVNDPTLAQGQWLSYDATDNVGLADANDSATSLLGMAAAAHDNGADTQDVYSIEGQIFTVNNTYVDGGSPSAGQEMFLSETAGNITATVPTTSGANVIYVGTMVSATQIRFDVEHRYTVA